MGKYLGAGMGLLSLLIVVAIVLYMSGKEAEVAVQPGGPLDQAKKVADEMNKHNADLDKQVANESAPQTPAVNGQPVAASPAPAPAGATADPNRPTTPVGKVKGSIPNQIHSPAEDMLKDMQ